MPLVEIRFNVDTIPIEPSTAQERELRRSVEAGFINFPGLSALTMTLVPNKSIPIESPQERHNLEKLNFEIQSANGKDAFEIHYHPKGKLAQSVKILNLQTENTYRISEIEAAYERKLKTKKKDKGFRLQKALSNFRKIFRWRIYKQYHERSTKKRRQAIAHLHNDAVTKLLDRYLGIFLRQKNFLLFPQVEKSRIWVQDGEDPNTVYMQIILPGNLFLQRNIVSKSGKEAREVVSDKQMALADWSFTGRVSGKEIIVDRLAIEAIGSEELLQVFHDSSQEDSMHTPSEGDGDSSDSQVSVRAISKINDADIYRQVLKRHLLFHIKKKRWIGRVFNEDSNNQFYATSDSYLRERGAHSLPPIILKHINRFKEEYLYEYPFMDAVIRWLHDLIPHLIDFFEEFLKDEEINQAVSNCPEFQNNPSLLLLISGFFQIITVALEQNLRTDSKVSSIANVPLITLATLFKYDEELRKQGKGDEFEAYLELRKQEKEDEFEEDLGLATLFKDDEDLREQGKDPRRLLEPLQMALRKAYDPRAQIAPFTPLCELIQAKVAEAKELLLFSLPELSNDPFDRVPEFELFARSEGDEFRKKCAVQLVTDIDDTCQRLDWPKEKGKISNIIRFASRSKILRPHFDSSFKEVVRLARPYVLENLYARTLPYVELPYCKRICLIKRLQAATNAYWEKVAKKAASYKEYKKNLRFFEQNRENVNTAEQIKKTIDDALLPGKTLHDLDAAICRIYKLKEEARDKDSSLGTILRLFSGKGGSELYRVIDAIMPKIPEFINQLYRIVMRFSKFEPYLLSEDKKELLRIQDYMRKNQLSAKGVKLAEKAVAVIRKAKDSPQFQKVSTAKSLIKEAERVIAEYKSISQSTPIHESISNQLTSGGGEQTVEPAPPSRKQSNERRTSPYLFKNSPHSSADENSSSGSRTPDPTTVSDSNSSVSLPGRRSAPLERDPEVSDKTPLLRTHSR